MKRGERKVYCRCIAVMAVYIISAVYVYTLPSQAHTVEIAENVPYLDETVSGEEFTAEPSETPKNGKIREISGMPCENTEQFERWYATYEQETSEEDADEASNVEMGEEMGRYPNRQEEVEAENLSNAEEMETTQSDNVWGETQSEVVYSVNGETLNPELQSYLYQRLADYQLEWFMPYAIMIAYQESHFDQYDVSDDGLDYGLLQFRKQFWDWSRGDIFDPYAQIDVFVELMSNRANAGCDLYEMISRHMQSDYGEYNADYVATVLSHEPNLKEVEQ